MRTSVTPTGHEVRSIDHLFSLYQADGLRRGKASAHDDGSRYRCHIQARIGHLSPLEVTPDHISACLPYHGSPATRQQVIAPIRGMFNWAKRRRLYRGDNPTDGVDRKGSTTGGPPICPRCRSGAFWNAGRAPRFIFVFWSRNLCSAVGAVGNCWTSNGRTSTSKLDW